MAPILALATTSAVHLYIQSTRVHDFFEKLQSLAFVPTFHGHAHNQACQLCWHPLYIASTGLKDFETSECVFSLSNVLASGTHHASAFHWHQAIEQHFAFWDEDKYANLSELYLKEI